MEEDPLSTRFSSAVWVVSAAIILQSVVPAYSSNEIRTYVVDVRSHVAGETQTRFTGSDRASLVALGDVRPGYSNNHVAISVPGIVLAFSENGVPTQSELLRTHTYQAVNGEVHAAQAAYLQIAEHRQEIFTTPTWLQKGLFQTLQRAGFAVAQIDIALTDIANGEPTQIPSNVAKEDALPQLLNRRATLFARYEEARRAMASAVSGQPRAQTVAQQIIEKWHARGMVPPNLERHIDDELSGLRKPFNIVFKAATGQKTLPVSEVREAAQEFSDYEAMRQAHPWTELAEQLDHALLSIPRAPMAQASEIHERDRTVTRDRSLVANIYHMIAREQGIRSGTVFPVPHVDKQMRPTCSVNTLRGMMAAFKVRRPLESLVREARTLLQDPFVGITTAFNHAKQLRLFRHYGDIAEVEDNKLFQTLVKAKKSIKVSIEYGDSVFKHSVVLEGFYMLGSVAYVVVRDYESHFPIYMKLEDFASVYIHGSALMFKTIFSDGPRA